MKTRHKRGLIVVGVLALNLIQRAGFRFSLFGTLKKRNA